MLLIDGNDIKKYYGDRLIVSADKIQIFKGDRIGVVGENGSGKTTFLNMLAGIIEPDRGKINRFCEVAYIRQFEDCSSEYDGKLLKEFNVKDKLERKELSGGERTKLRIAGELYREKGILLADEPTSNLDYESIQLFREKINEVETFVLVSHDSCLLDRLCSRIYEIKDGKLREYSVGFSEYRILKEKEINRQWLIYDKYTTEKKKLHDALMKAEHKSDSIKKAPSRMGNSEARLHKGKTSEKRKKIDESKKAIKNRLEKLEVKEKPLSPSAIKINFELTDPPENRIIVRGEDLNFSYKNNVIFKNAYFNVHRGYRTAIIGENGSGKTTLFNLIMDAHQGISVVPKAKIGYFYQGFENINMDKSVLENIMESSIQSETSVRTVLNRLLIKGEDVYKKAGVLSGGERIKASIAKIILSEANVIFLDEPTNYLDMSSIEALGDVICEYEGTVLLVSHDRSFVEKTADRLLVINNRRIEDYEGKLSEYNNRKEKVNEGDREMKMTMLKMKQAEIISKLSEQGCNKEFLEREYAIVLNNIKKLQ